MNRFWFLIAALTLLALPSAQAQYIRNDARRPSGHLGLTTGLATTWIVDRKLLEDPNYQYVQTYRRAPIGFTAGYHFNDRNGIQVEFVSVKQGADFQILTKTDVEERVGTKNINLTYWSIPILFKYTGGVARPARFEFHVGPQLNLLSSGEEINRYTQDGILKVQRANTDLMERNTRDGYSITAGTSDVLARKADLRASTWSAVFGLGLEFKIYGPLYASTLLRGTFSLNDVRGGQLIGKARSFQYYTGRNSAVLGLQVGLHYQFISPAEGHPKDRGY